MTPAVVGRVFLDQTYSVFQEMLDLPLSGGKPCVKRDRATGHLITVSTMLAGRMSGTVALGLEPSVAFYITNRLLNERISQLCPQVTDAVGEIANIVFGSARSKLAEMGYPEVNSSLPLVGYGRGQPLMFPSGAIPMQLPFASSQGSSSLVLALQTNPVDEQLATAVTEPVQNQPLHEAVAPLLKVSRVLPVDIRAAAGAETRGVLLAMTDRELTLLVEPTVEQAELSIQLREPMPASLLSLAVASSRMIANFREVTGHYRQAS